MEAISGLSKSCSDLVIHDNFSDLGAPEPKRQASLDVLRKKNEQLVIKKNAIRMVARNSFSNHRKVAGKSDRHKSEELECMQGLGSESDESE